MSTTQTLVTMNSYCSFCASAGIKGPHDHFLRASRDQGAKVVCPKLLNTECNYCHRFGHTVRFCAAKKEQEMLAAAARASALKSRLNAGEWMDVGTHQKSEHPGFESPRVAKPKTATPSAPKLASRFAALDLESDSSSCDECEAPAAAPRPLRPPAPPRARPPLATTLDMQGSSVWADVVKKGRAPTPPPVPQSWEDEELPPLIFGQKLQTRWADEV